jgi:hypothetical protein
MTPDAAARIQSAAARSGGGGVPKGSFASRAQSAADKNVNAGRVDRDGRRTNNDDSDSDDDD